MNDNTEVYNDAVYKSTDGYINMTNSTFDMLWSSIRDTNLEAVKVIEYEGVMYWGYSQSVPQDIDDLSEVRFAIFFMLPRETT